MRIGALADRTGIAPKTIRYYEQIELLPEPRRESSGYRDYDEGAVARLGVVRAAQSVGFSLGEIREILAFRDRGETPCAHVSGLIERRVEDLGERIAELERMRRDLQLLARRARRRDGGATAARRRRRSRILSHHRGAPARDGPRPVACGSN